MSAAYTVSCFIVVILNIVFLLLSLVLIALGGVVAGGKEIIKAALTVVTNFIPKTVNIDDIISEGLKLVSSIAVALIVVGVIVLAITIIAVCGSCCKSKCLLIVYVIAISVVFLGQIILIGVYFGEKPTFEKNAKKYLTETITEKYQGDNATNFESVGWSLINLHFQCCGVENGTDFENAKYWSPKYYSYENKEYGPLKYPVSCCKQESGKFKNIKECTENQKTEYSNHNTGCWNSLDKEVGDNLNIFIYCIAGICGAQFIVILLVIIMICKVEKE